jgi:hypothetical protein
MENDSMSMWIVMIFVAVSDITYTLKFFCVQDVMENIHLHAWHYTGNFFCACGY